MNDRVSTAAAAGRDVLAEQLAGEERLAAPNFLTPGADSAHSRPLISVGTMKTMAPTASRRLTNA